MKSATRKYQKLENAIYKANIELDGNWKKGFFTQPTEARKYFLIRKIKEYQEKEKALKKLITKEDFETDLADNMCCTWEDFKS